MVRNREMSVDKYSRGGKYIDRIQIEEEGRKNTAVFIMMVKNRHSKQYFLRGVCVCVCVCVRVCVCFEDLTINSKFLFNAGLAAC